MSEPSACSVADCNHPAVTRGWCLKHYTRWKRHGDPLAVKQIVGDDLARFMVKVSKQADGCWHWTGARTDTGYGQFRMDSGARLAHRVAYALHVGPIPESLTLDHLCRVRHCVNPAHLEPVTQHVNLHRGQTITAANAAKTHCVHGHAFTAQNTYTTTRGGRRCRTCRQQQRAEHQARTGR